MNKKHFIVGVLLASFAGAFVALGLFSFFNSDAQPQESVQTNEQVMFSSLVDTSAAFIVPEGLNFVAAAAISTPAVVHIKSTFERASSNGNRPWQDLFFDQRGGQSQPRQGRSSGSGVIISSDGYIATNNHVVENSDVLEVTLEDNRKYEGTVVGTDPNTDLALIKIEEDGLPFLKYGNSDRLRIGEWVLAVGNPFDLTSTVTAGIVSAKGRDINILQRSEGYSIESFIQTDAAVNPGNSGGALVDLRGNLIGINTAIATEDGSFAGYSFAVPVSLVEKVMDDIREFGEVQRALLGIKILDVEMVREDLGLDEYQGVYVREVSPGGAAAEAGIKNGDVITHIDDKETSTVQELQEMVGRNNPGAQIKVTVSRDGNKRDLIAKLKNLKDTGFIDPSLSFEDSGATFKNLTEREKAGYKVEGGVKISKLRSGVWKEIGIPEGFIITHVNKNKVEGVGSFKDVINEGGDKVLVEGIYPRSGKEGFFILSK